jgi:hypothetical protein
MGDMKIQVDFGNVVCHGECGGTFSSHGFAEYPNGEFREVHFDTSPILGEGEQSVRPCPTCLKELESKNRKFFKVWEFFVATCLVP